VREGRWSARTGERKGDSGARSRFYGILASDWRSRGAAIDGEGGRRKSQEEGGATSQAVAACKLVVTTSESLTTGNSVLLQRTRRRATAQPVEKKNKHAFQS